MDRRKFLRNIGIGGAITAPAAGIAVATSRPPAIKPGIPIEDRPCKRTFVICGVVYSYHIFEDWSIERMKWGPLFRVRRINGGPVEIQRVETSPYRSPDTGFYDSLEYLNETT